MSPFAKLIHHVQNILFICSIRAVHPARESTFPLKIYIKSKSTTI